MMQYNETILDNGLRVISSGQTGSPIVTIAVWIKAGSRYEEDEERGYAHLLEHMLMKGTKKRPTVFEINKLADRLGAFSNAFTSGEAAYFIIQVAKEYAQDMVELLADRVLNSLIFPEVLTNEKKVVIEEIHRAIQDNTRFTRMLALEHFFKGHPLANDPLGEEDTVASSTSERLRKYYARLYIPNRAAIITVGGLTHQAAVTFSQKYFNKWISGEKSVTVKNTPQNFYQKEKKYHFQERPIKQTLLAFSYHTPGGVSLQESVILDIVANYFGYGQTAFLYNELRHKRGLVYSLTAKNEIYSDAGRFTISTATTNPEKTVQVLCEAIKNSANFLTKNLLEEIKTQTINSFVRLNANPMNEMQFFGQGFIVANRFVTPEEYTKRLTEITDQDVEDVIKKYLSQEKVFITAVGPDNFLKH